MRVLIVSFPWRTHLFTLVPLAWALRAAGHEVRVASEPEMTDAIVGCGLTAVPVGPGTETMGDRMRRAWREGMLPTPDLAPPMGEPVELFELGPDRRRLDWKELNRLYDTLVVPRAELSNTPMLDGLVAYCRSWRPDLVVWNAVTFAAPIAAEAVGAAHARVLYSVDLYTRIRDDYLRVQAEQPPQERVDHFRDWVTAAAARHGVPFSEDLVDGHVTIDQLPPSFRLPSALPTLSTRFVPFNGPAVIPDWLSAPPPRRRVLMTSGLSVTDWPELRVVPLDRVQDILDHVADLDIELVLTIPGPLQDRLRAPANTRLVEYVPMAAILPTCAAVVHHGGTGSFGTSIAYGVPQLMLSQALDAPIKGRRLTELRAGLSIIPDDVTGAGVRDALLRLLDDPAFAEGARRLRDEALAQPAPADTVHALERLVATRRSGTGPR
ncbi:activator-dependent family glycosyltransferase [Dactylosporangium sp. NPDC051485]|uniref:activator-dependent family glycosyltransferase n=1 Tax=Dactylosporangium sp. NPDC051485 TaxID=3154846 RepID=UPI003446FB38